MKFSVDPRSLSRSTSANCWCGSPGWSLACASEISEPMWSCSFHPCRLREEHPRNFAFIPVSVWYWCGLTGFAYLRKAKDSWSLAQSELDMSQNHALGTVPYNSWLTDGYSPKYGNSIDSTHPQLLIWGMVSSLTWPASHQSLWWLSAPIALSGFTFQPLGYGSKWRATLDSRLRKKNDDCDPSGTLLSSHTSWLGFSWK